MAFTPFYLKSLFGRFLGLTNLGELANKRRDLMYSGVAYASTAASTAVSNTVSETVFDTKYTLPANSVRPGTRIRVTFQGIATATNSTDTLAIKLRIGGVAGTTLLTLAARDVANNDIFWGQADIVIRTVGSSGTLVACGLAPANPNAAGTAANINFTASSTINTTIANDIVVTAQWSVANAGNSCRLDVMIVELP